MAKVKYPMCYVVLGPGHGKMAGRIKSIPLAHNIRSTLVEFKEGMKRPRLWQSEEEKGSVFLETLFEAEKKTAELAAYLEFRRQIDDGRQVLPFPDSMLPATVLKWRNEQGEEAGPFNPEVFAKASAEQPKASAAKTSTSVEQPKVSAPEKPKA